MGFIYRGFSCNLAKKPSGCDIYCNDKLPVLNIKQNLGVRDHYFQGVD